MATGPVIVVLENMRENTTENTIESLGDLSDEELAEHSA